MRYVRQAIATLLPILLTGLATSYGVAEVGQSVEAADRDSGQERLEEDRGRAGKWPRDFAQNSPAAPVLGAEEFPRFRMPEIAAPKIPDDVEWQAIGPWTLDQDSLPESERRLSDNWAFMRGGGRPDYMIRDTDARSHAVVLRGSNLPGLRVQRVRVNDGTVSSAGGGIARVGGQLDGAVFTDLTYRGDISNPGKNTGDPWAAIALVGKGANDVGTFVIDRFDFQNMIMSEGDRYANADGISTERGYSGSITNGRVLNASDACLDIKGEVHVDNVYLAGCRQGIKAWSSQSHGLVVMGSNRVAAILGAGSEEEPRSMFIETLILEGDPSIPVFRAENGVFNLTIGTLVAPRGQIMKDETSTEGSHVEVRRRVDAATLMR